MDELDELIEFLSDTRPPIKQHAAELVQGLTGSAEGCAQLAARSDKLLPPLFRLAGSGGDPASRPALVALVNLSQEPTVQQGLLGLNAVARCMDYIRERSAHTGPKQQGGSDDDLLVMLLANLTSLEAGAEALLQVGRGALEGFSVAVLLKHFLAPVLPGQADAYEHVATVLPNVTRIAAGRKLLLQPGRGLLQALASQLGSESELRRRGCSGAIKNCCFSCEQDGTAEDIAGETEALSTMLDVLCGPSTTISALSSATTSSGSAGATAGDGGKAGGGDEGVREALAEAVLCLARVDGARKKLWACNAPTLLQQGYEYEENPTICACMEATAELFLSDGFEPLPGMALPGGGDGGDAVATTTAAAADQDCLPQQPAGRAVQIEEID